MRSGIRSASSLFALAAIFNSPAIWPHLDRHVHGNLGVRLVAVQRDVRQLEAVDVSHLGVDAA
jgi:hypothetical protein